MHGNNVRGEGKSEHISQNERNNAGKKPIDGINQQEEDDEKYCL